MAALHYAWIVSAPDRSVTELLVAMREGDAAAFDDLVPLVYDELKRIARRQLGGERFDVTLGASGLVHETFLKLVGQARAEIRDRAHFLAVAAFAMRRILVDRARARLAGKRGAGLRPVTFEDQLGDDADADTILAINEALTRLSELSARQARVVVCRFFGGFTDEEIAEALAVSVPTVRRDWRMARAWLTRELGA